MPQTPRLIVIAGPSASGKTTVAKYIVEKYGAHRAKYSDILIDIADQRGLGKTKEELQKLSTALRREHGEDYLTKLMGENLRLIDAPRIVLEGTRRIIDVAFATRFGEETGRKVLFIYVDAKPGTRRVRMNVRLLDEGGSTVTEEEFALLEADECEEELPLVRAFMKERGAIIDNTALDLRELFGLVDTVLLKTE